MAFQIWESQPCNRTRCKNAALWGLQNRNLKVQRKPVATHTSSERTLWSPDPASDRFASFVRTRNLLVTQEKCLPKGADFSKQSEETLQNEKGEPSNWQKWFRKMSGTVLSTSTCSAKSSSQETSRPTYCAAIKASKALSPWSTWEQIKCNATSLRATKAKVAVWTHFDRSWQALPFWSCSCQDAHRASSCQNRGLSSQALG